MQECEPAVKFNESREAEQERAKESAVPSTDMRIQFTSFKYESKHREKRNFAKDRKKKNSNKIQISVISSTG